MTCYMRHRKNDIYVLQKARLVYQQEQFLKLNAIIWYPPFWEYITWKFTTTIYWGCMQWCITKTESVDSPGWEFSDFLDQASWCHVGTAGSLGLHRCGMGCHRLWCQGILLNNCHGRNSWGLFHLDCLCWRCSRCGLHAWCRLWQCRLYHWKAVSCWSLQCGSCATWDSVNHLDTAFTEVPPCVAVCGTIAGAYLIAALWEDAYHSSRNPNPSKGVICCNWLTSIQWCKCFAAFVSLSFSSFGACVNLLTDLYGWWVRMVVLSWHWYNSSVGDGSLVLIGVAQSASKVRCGSAPLYLAHWSACLMDLMHASVNLLDCG